MREDDDDNDDWLDAESDETLDWLSLQSPPEGDFLGTPGAEPHNDTFLAILNDDISPRVRHPDVPDGVDVATRNMLVAAQRMHPRQRTFVRALIQEAGNEGRAIKLFNARSRDPLNVKQAQNWMMYDDDFRLVYKEAARQYLSVAGIDPQGVLLRTVKVVNEALTPVPILYKGRHTGYYEQDRGNAMRGIEFLGKVNKMVGSEENRTRLVVQVIDMSGQAEVEVAPIEHDADV